MSEQEPLKHGLPLRDFNTPPKPMTREMQTWIIVGAMLAISLVVLCFYINSVDDDAIRNGEPERCWTPTCKNAAIDTIERSYER